MKAIIIVFLALMCFSVNAFTVDQQQKLDELYSQVNYSLLGLEFVAWVNDDGVFLDGVQTWWGQIVYNVDLNKDFRKGIIVHSHPPFMCEPSQTDITAKQLLTSNRITGFGIHCGLGKTNIY
jgi:hypothetical protein